MLWTIPFPVRSLRAARRSSITALAAESPPALRDGRDHLATRPDRYRPGSRPLVNAGAAS
jgi:hypothetical protein